MSEAIIIGLFIIILVLLWLLDRDRNRHEASQDQLRRQLMALVDKAAVSITENSEDQSSGKVTYMDEKREYELQERVNADAS
jgi:hypothetical protein